MTHISETDKMMVEKEGAEFLIGLMYYKHINGSLHRAKVDSEEWQTAHIKESTWKGSSKYVNLRKEGGQDDQQYSK